MSSSVILAQKYEFVPGEILVQASDEKSLNSIMSHFMSLKTRALKSSSTITTIEKISSNIVPLSLIKVNESEVESLILSLRNQSGIVHVQRNKVLTQRAPPNDPEFAKQWTINNTIENFDHRVLKAWDLTTGGVTATGDTIVVAVVDDGVSRHEDLIDNLWINHNEIPGDKIDNDGNGYTDDYYGWNSQAKNDNIFTEQRHGTAIAGIIGAKGNNEKGITGINWNVKVMVIDMGNITEANALAAYSYVYDMRKLYNESGGKKGAFIIASNSSWGIDFGKAKDSPIWCGFYDKLGEVGILNCAASVNQNIDVDILGDLPTTCPSDYLIGVTNLNRFNAKNSDASFGKKSIDLGAYGQRAYTTSTSNRYFEFVGTSSATPHVAGAIALAYSVPCKELALLMKSKPGQAAKLVKHILLSSVTPNESIKTITSSGGVLNIGLLIENVNALCQNCPPILSELDTENQSELTAAISVIKDSSLVDVRIRPVGDTLWTNFFNLKNKSKISIPALCKEYEYQVRTTCKGPGLDSFGYSRFFESYGCCPSVSGLSTSNTLNAFNFSVKLPDLADYMYLEYRQKDENQWRNIKMTDRFSLSDVASCQLYEYRAYNSCLNERTKSDTTEISFLPSPCGSCTSGKYCLPSPSINRQEWIESVKLGENEWKTGKGQQIGYSPLLSYKIPVVKKSTKIPVSIIPGYAGQSFRERFYIYVDLNQDGVFENGELVLENTERLTQLNDTLVIPVNALNGITRMRVIMSFSATDSPCTWNELFGEVEDYCIQIESPNFTAEFDKVLNVSTIISDNMYLNIEDPEIFERITYEIYSMTGQILLKDKLTKNVINCSHLPTGTYFMVLSSTHVRQSFKFIKL